MADCPRHRWVEPGSRHDWRRRPATAVYELVTAAALVEAVARAHGLLDLADTDDTMLLRARLVAVGGADVVLTAGEDAAYAPGWWTG